MYNCVITLKYLMKIVKIIIILLSFFISEVQHHCYFFNEVLIQIQTVFIYLLKIETAAYYKL